MMVTNHGREQERWRGPTSDNCDTRNDSGHAVDRWRSSWARRLSAGAPRWPHPPAERAPQRVVRPQLPAHGIVDVSPAGRGGRAAAASAGPPPRQQALQ
jgi:hypothetical protein